MDSENTKVLLRVEIAEKKEEDFFSAVLPSFWLKREWLWPEEAFPEVLEVLRHLEVI